MVTVNISTTSQTGERCFMMNGGYSTCALSFHTLTSDWRYRRLGDLGPAALVLLIMHAPTESSIQVCYETFIFSQQFSELNSSEAPLDAYWCIYTNSDLGQHRVHKLRIYCKSLIASQMDILTIHASLSCSLYGMYGDKLFKYSFITRFIYIRFLQVG